MQSSVYELGEQRGEQKAVVRSYELRLRRPLTESERSAIATRMGTLGIGRLLGVRDELSADALAAWLADPAAT